MSENKQDEINKPNIIYTNAVNVETSRYDFALEAYYRSGDKLYNHTKLVMSPQHYKMLIHVMVQNLNKYEELFGPINMEINQEAFERLEKEGILQVEDPNDVGRK